MTLSLPHLIHLYSPPRNTLMPQKPQERHPITHITPKNTYQPPENTPRKTHTHTHTLLPHDSPTGQQRGRRGGSVRGQEGGAFGWLVRGVEGWGRVGGKARGGLFGWRQRGLVGVEGRSNCVWVYHVCACVRVCAWGGG